MKCSKCGYIQNEPFHICRPKLTIVKTEVSNMCGGVYEEDFDYVPETKTETTEKGSSGDLESGDGRMMGDIKFMTAGQIIELMNDESSQ